MRRYPRSYFKKIILTILVVAACGFGASQHASAQIGNYLGEMFKAPSPLFSMDMGGRNAAIIHSTMSNALEVGKVKTLPLKDSAVLDSFYAERKGKTLWVEPRRNQHPKVISILSVLEQSWMDGLNPATYHVSEIRALSSAGDPASKAQLELLVSDGITRYAHDMTGIRFSPQAIRQDPSSWRTPVAARSFLNAAAETRSIEDLLASIVPSDPMYQKLKKELFRLVTEAAKVDEDKLKRIAFGGYVLKPGQSHPNVFALRTRLGIAHDPAKGAENDYDDDLAAAVMSFQKQRGISPDGVIGSQTLALLNRSYQDDIRQVIANMERLRWLEQERPGKYILVNIPSSTLWAVENGEVRFEMPVIVGRPQRQTKSFITQITGVRFNPKWTVPPTIKAEDFLPKLIENPYYLQDSGIEVTAMLDGRRVLLDSSLIEWNRVTKKDLSDLRMQQAAGDNNALGRIRVLMDNPYDIYLHDTNAPQYFKKPDRALSSGCIRLSEPEKVADFILEKNPNWSASRRQSIINRGRTTEVAAETTIPVYILYMTIWQDMQGNLVYGPDIYDQDQRLIKMMEETKSFHIPDSASLHLASSTENIKFQ